MPSILRVVALADLDRHNAKMLAEFARETDVPVANASATLGGDARKLRGIPALAKGVGGAMAHTLPHVEIARDRRD